MSIVPELRSANAGYASTFDQADLPAEPVRRLAVVTCMDCRLDPLKFLGLADGDAHVIRNAGGLVTDDALRSLVISHWLLGTREAVVIGHESCGMLTFTNSELRQKLAAETGHDAGHVDFCPFGDLLESVRSSVQKIRDSPLLPESFGATGFVYDVRNGAIRKVT